MKLTLRLATPRKEKERKKKLFVDSTKKKKNTTNDIKDKKYSKLYHSTITYYEIIIYALLAVKQPMTPQ